MRASPALVGLALTGPLLGLVPLACAVHAALQPVSRFARADRSPAVWVVVSLLVPLGWLLYVAWLVPRLRRADDRHRVGQMLAGSRR